MSPLAELPPGPLTEGDSILAGLSFAFLHHEMISGVAGLETVDALLVLAINQANIAPLTRDPDARARYGQLDAPAPDTERRPVSVNAVAASVGLPFETVRRRIKRLAAEGVCTISPDGVVAPASFLVSRDYLHSVMRAHERMRGFYGELCASGLVHALPEPAYPPEESVPVRAAARLLSDYVLRTCEGLLREAGNVISALALAAMLAAALRRPGDPDGPARPISTKALAGKLRLPAETVRRHAAELVEEGLCVRTTAGLLMTQECLARPGVRLLFADNVTNVHRLLAGLAERGVIRAWEEADAAAVRQESA